MMAVDDKIRRIAARWRKSRPKSIFWANLGFASSFQILDRCEYAGGVKRAHALVRKRVPFFETAYRGALLALCLIAFSGCAHSSLVDSRAGWSGTLFDATLDFYQGPLNHLSAVRYGQCPMYPSCSQYSRQAVARHGAVLGWVMAMDRLMRCGRSELASAPLVNVNGRWLYYDPVASNEFWRHAKENHPPDPTFSTGHPEAGPGGKTAKAGQ